MPNSICIYSELEPYSGSINNNLSALPSLIWDLKFASLFYDTVIVHNRNILEHPLTLPAFEALAPLVRSGKLWTTADHSAPPPLDYFLKTAEKFFGKRSNKVNKIKDRWARIIPNKWILNRNVNTQVTGVMNNIADYLFNKLSNRNFSNVRHLLDFVQRMQADNLFNRHLTLAKIGTLRGLLHPAEISEIAIAIQAEYIRAGAEIHKASIYPGKSFQCFTHLNTRLPFDHSTLFQVKERLKNVGIDLNDLITLPVSTLFDIATSEEWLVIRNALLSNHFDLEIQEKMRSVFMINKPFPDKLATILNISGDIQNFNSPPIIIPSPWALTGQTLLGNYNVATDDIENKTFILNLDNGCFYKTKSPKSKKFMTKKQTHLLSLLIIAGKLGLNVEHIKQLDIEMNQITRKEPQWNSQANPLIIDDKSLTDKIYQLKERTNDKLKALGLKICVEIKRWYLGTCSKKLTRTNLTFKLSGTIWETFEKKEVKYIPPSLSDKNNDLRIIWEALWERSPYIINAEALAKELGKNGDNENIEKQISNQIDKLKKRHLKDEKWMIIDNNTREYALIPRLVSPTI